MELRYFQKGFNYSQDGPGNRLVYHLQGCNMHCPWCANPEGMTPGKGKCLSAEAVLEEILRSRMMFFDGGGVTFTGGEPTMQFDALKQLLQELKKAGVDTALETNGTHPRLPELFDCLDHLMMDFKQPFPEAHRHFTGVPQDQVLQNLARASARPDLLVRIPLINGVNASREDMAEFCRFLRQLPSENLRVEVLRYHEYGRVKWEKEGMAYTMTDAFVTDEQYNTFVEMLKQCGLRVVRT